MRRPTLFMGTCRRIRMAWVISKIGSLVHETVHESPISPRIPLNFHNSGANVRPIPGPFFCHTSVFCAHLHSY